MAVEEPSNANETNMYMAESPSFAFLQSVTDAVLVNSDNKQYCSRIYSTPGAAD